MNRRLAGLVHELERIAADMRTNIRWLRPQMMGKDVVICEWTLGETVIHIVLVLGRKQPFWDPQLGQIGMYPLFFSLRSDDVTLKDLILEVDQLDASAVIQPKRPNAREVLQAVNQDLASIRKQAQYLMDKNKHKVIARIEGNI